MTTSSGSPDSTAAVLTITDDIKNRLSRAHKSSEESLNEHRAIGEALINAKALLRGSYLKWAAEEFSFSKQWCARLSKLAKSWGDYQKARSWAQEQGHLPGNELTVDGALALVRKRQNTIGLVLQAETDSPKRSKTSETKAELETTRADLEAARVTIQDTNARLAEALTKIVDLEAQLAAASGRYQNTHDAEPTGAVDWISLSQDAQAADVAAHVVDTGSVSEGSGAVTISVGRSEYEALVEEAAANDISLQESLLMKVLSDASDQDIGSWRQPTKIEKLLHRKGISYVIEERLRTLSQEECFGPDVGTVIRTYSS